MRIVVVTAFFNNVVTTTVIEMVEMVEILDGRLGKRSVERVRYVINNLLHLLVVKYGDISLVLCISTRLRLVTILSLLVKYLVIFHADPCNKSYLYCSQGRNISQGRRSRKIFATEDAIYAGISQGRVEYLVDYICHFLFCLTTVSAATYPLSMPSIRGGDWGGTSIYIIPPLRKNLIGPFHALM